jgi:A/G-specific adenine glycosylase
MKQADNTVASPSAVAEPLLAWFDHSGRKQLPWQQNTTAYRVWVSEIMLQQTQVATVIPYYERFMQRFADVQSLAAAPIDEVLHLWTGLGYYARARNLHRAAQIIVSKYAGIFPDTIEAVQSLPGIGRSTAGAVLALSASQRHPILDGNVKRVLTRYFGIQGFPGELAVERKLWSVADACTPTMRVANYTQAIMDLGATVCMRSRPLCIECPLSEHCIARIADRQAELPTRRPKKERPQRVAHVVIARRDDGALLLERRPPAGIWGGLWTFPQFDDQAAALSWIGQWRGAAQDPDAPAPLASYSHAFTHFDLTLHPLLMRASPTSTIADADRYCWYDPRRPARIGLAKPAVDLIRLLNPDVPGNAGVQAALL